MGFLGNFFGQAKPERVEVSLGEAGQFLEKNVSGKRKQLFDESAKKLAEIKHLLREAKASLQNLESAEAEARSSRIDKIVKTAKSNALRQIFALLEKLSPPNTSDLAAIKQYCNDSIIALRLSGNFGKNVAYAGISFKEEVKELGICMRQLGQAFSSLQQLLNENKAVFMQEAVKAKLNEIGELRQSIVSFENSLARLQKELENVLFGKSRLEADLKRLRESSEFRAIDSLNEEKASLLREKQKAKTELLDLFSKVEKPLHRLGKAVNARKVLLPGMQAELLHQFLQNPFMALKKDPKAESLKEILLEAKKAIDSGVIDLKEKEREKKLGVLQELISFDFFTGSFWRFNKIDSQILAIERKLNELPGLKKESELISSLKQAQAKEASVKEETDLKKSQIDAAKAAIQKEMQSTQGILSEVTGKQVSLRA